MVDSFLAGSGKTLAFVIPLLECLWREQWTSLDGVGAIVISPTRELAFQTFEVVLRKLKMWNYITTHISVFKKKTFLQSYFFI